MEGNYPFRKENKNILAVIFETYFSYGKIIVNTECD
jgi:hypothetical protein